MTCSLNVQLTLNYYHQTLYLSTLHQHNNKDLLTAPPVHFAPTQHQEDHDNSLAPSEDGLIAQNPSFSDVELEVHQFEGETENQVDVGEVLKPTIPAVLSATVLAESKIQPAAPFVNTETQLAQPSGSTRPQRNSAPPAWHKDYVIHTKPSGSNKYPLSSHIAYHHLSLAYQSYLGVFST